MNFDQQQIFTSVRDAPLTYSNTYIFALVSPTRDIYRNKV